MQLFFSSLLSNEMKEFNDDARDHEEKRRKKNMHSKVDRNSKNSNARMPPTHIQTRTQKCKVKENHFLKPQNSSSKDQRSM